MENRLGDEQNLNTTMQEDAAMNVDELIQSTVRAILTYQEQSRPLQNLAGSSMPMDQGQPRPIYNNNEIAALLSVFEGIKQNVNLWLERVESVQRVYGVSDDLMQLIAVGKFAGRAKEWYQSRVDFITMDWETLKGEMKKMFSIEADPITLRRTMERRRWRKTENFSTYFHEKVLLGNNAGITEKEMIHYVIEGFDDKQLQNQARMLLHQFNTLEDLFKTMCNVVREENASMRNTSAIPRNPLPPGQRQQYRNSVRCYNCNREGHKLADCDKPRREKGSCFRCGRMGHRVKECPQRQVQADAAEPDSTSSTVTLVEENSLPKAFTIKVYILALNIEIESILDSGSPVSLITETLIPRNLIRTNSKSNLLLKGINNST